MVRNALLQGPCRPYRDAATHRPLPPAKKTMHGWIYWLEDDQPAQAVSRRIASLQLVLAISSLPSHFAKRAVAFWDLHAGSTPH